MRAFPLLQAPARARSPSAPRPVHPVPVRLRHLPPSHFLTPAGLACYVSECSFASPKAFRAAPSRPVGKKAEGQGERGQQPGHLGTAVSAGLGTASLPPAPPPPPPASGCAQALREEGWARVSQWERKLGAGSAQGSPRATRRDLRRREARAVACPTGISGAAAPRSLPTVTCRPVQWDKGRWERRALRRAPVSRAGAPVRMRPCPALGSDSPSSC